MAQFTQNFRASQIQVAQPVSAFIQGRAAGMAYRQDKVKEKVLQEQANSLAYSNSPNVRAMEMSSAKTDVAYKQVQMYKAMNPDKKVDTVQIRDGEDYVTSIEVDGVPVKEIARSPIRTGTEADPNILGQKAINKVESQIVDLTVAYSEVNALDLSSAEDLLTYQGKFTSFLARQADKLGVSSDEQIERINKDQKLRSQVRQSFQKIRTAVTGAQAAMVELTYLEDAYFSDKMSPAQLRRAKQVFLESTSATITILSNLRQRGISQGTVEFGTEFNKQWKQLRPTGLDEFIPKGAVEAPNKVGKIVREYEDGSVLTRLPD